MKTCTKCKDIKPLTEFYSHKKTSDGLMGKCKECTKGDARKNRKDNIEYYREYDRKRGNRQSREYLAEYRAANPNKYKAHNLVNNAIRDGKLFSEPCEICGIEFGVHAHHDDYAKPLNIRWLCAAHHKQWHAENGEGLNQ